MKRIFRLAFCTTVIICLAFALTQTSLAAGSLVTNDTVNFRAGASLDADVIRALDPGVSVEVLEHDPAGWTKVKFSGVEGYIKSDYLTIPSGASGIAFKTTDEVNFRTGPSLEASILYSLKLGSVVEAVEHDPAGWSKVRVDGTVGYIKSEFLALHVQNAQQGSNAQQGASAQQASNTQQGTAAAAQPSEAPKPAPLPDTLITIDEANVRQEPSLDSEIIIALSANSSVQALERGPDGWTKVMVDDMIGYIWSELLSVTGRNVELLDWSVVRNIIQRGAPIPVIDVRTGQTYYIKCFSIGDHADVETATKADTDIVFDIRGGVWSWAARPVWVLIGDRLVAASINGMPHDVSTISGNGLNGHFCLHFLGSVTSSTSVSYKQDLQNAVMEAWNAR